MTLFDTATELLVRLEAASAEDAGDELLARGRSVRDEVMSTAEHLEAVQSYRVAIGRTDAPSLDAKAMRQAIGRFRGALARSGPRALQQQSAATLVDVMTAQIKRVDRWVASTWRENFDASQELQERANSGDLHGSPEMKTKASGRAATIAVLRNKDPIRDRIELEERLKVEGLNALLERVNELVDDLRNAIAAIDLEHAAMTPEVRAVLQSSASDDGLPLAEVTLELMEALRSAGVLDDLVVRRL